MRLCLLCVQPLTGLNNLSVFYLLILLHRNHVHFMGMCTHFSVWFCAQNFRVDIVLVKFCSANWLYPQKRRTKSKTFVWAFVPLAIYPIIIIGCVGFVNLTARLLCGWKNELGSNSHLIWLFLSYLFVKILLVDKRQTTKNINKNKWTLRVIQCIVVASTNPKKSAKRNEEGQQIVQFPEVSSEILRSLTKQPILCSFWL